MLVRLRLIVSFWKGLKRVRRQEEGPVQIKMLDPIFHEEGDRPLKRGMEASETKQLQRKLNQERRAAARQLSRDAAVVQQLQHQKQETRRQAGVKEKKRVRQIMENEKQELKKMATEFDKSMNTTFGSFSKTKERKKANRRMAGNATADNPKEPKQKESKPTASPKADAKSKSSKKPKGGKRKARRLWPTFPTSLHAQNPFCVRKKKEKGRPERILEWSGFFSVQKLLLDSSLNGSIYRSLTRYEFRTWPEFI